MAKRRIRSGQQAWDPLTAKYASLATPEWVTMQKLPKFFWNDQKNHKRYMKWLAKELGIKHVDDWYKVSARDIIKRRGKALLCHYGQSHIQLIIKLVPRKCWHHWKFIHVSAGFWEQKENRIAYLNWLEAELNYKTPDDWYPVSFLDFRNNYGRVIIETRTTFEILTEFYPQHNWLPWKFRFTPTRYWDNKSNRLKYMKWLGAELGYKNKTDWYQLSKPAFRNNYGTTLLARTYNYLPYNAVRDLFPEYDWKPWLFTRVPTDLWSDKKNRVAYLKWLGEKLGFKSPNDWYQLCDSHFQSNRGTLLLESFYRHLPIRAVTELFPNRTWYPWLFNQVPRGFWKKKTNRILYLRWLGKKLECKTREDWMRVNCEDFKRSKGSSLLKKCSFEQIQKEAVLSLQ